MFARLTNPIRVRAGWLLALVYLLCVLAPAAALATGDAAPCLDVEAGIAAMMQADADSVAAVHMHQAGPHDQGASPTESYAAHHHHDGKTSAGPCCAMLCLSAVPADLPTIAKPSPAMAVLVSAIFRPLRGEAPPLLYRPPIA